MAFCTARTDATVPRPPFDGYYRINLPDLGPQGVADYLFSIYSSAFIVFYDTGLKNNVVFQIVSDHHSLVFCLRSVIMVYTHTASLNLLYLNIFKNTIQINTTYDLLHIYSMFCEICHASVGVFWLINKQKNEQSKHTSVKFKIPSIPRIPCQSWIESNILLFVIFSGIYKDIKFPKFSYFNLMCRSEDMRHALSDK